MADDQLEAVVLLLARGDDDAAVAAVRSQFGWPAGKTIAASELPRWLGLVAELAARREATQLAELARDAVRDPDSPDRLYDLGYALIDAGAPAVAATILWRCLALVGESEEVVCELVSALESALAYDDAFAILEQYADLRAHSFLVRYLHAFDAAMSGRLDITRRAAPELAPDSPEHETMAANILALVERADRIAPVTPLDRRDLRGWHHVLTGGLLLHRSPYGFDEPMHGRYAWLTDSYARIATGIERLHALCGSMDLQCVYAPPGHGHQILGHALATRFELPLVPWPAVGVPAPGLVALYDLAELTPSDVVRLVQRRADQVVYAHASPWTNDSPIAPDVTMLLYQTLVPPWGETMTVDPQTREIVKAAPDERAPALIAAEVLASPGLDAEETAHDDLPGHAAIVERVWPLPLGPRTRLWAGGPVPSSRFT